MAWPVLERPDVEGVVEQALTSGPPRAMLLRGASGIGKTTVARRVAHTLGAGGSTVLPIVGLAELHDAPLAPLVPLLPALGLSYRDGVGLTARDVIAAIGARARSVVLLVDDAPLLDGASAAVVYQLVRAFAVPTMLTARTGHELEGPVRRLLDEGAATSLDLDGLSRGQVDTLLRRHLGATVRPDDVTRLSRLSGGNPLHLRGLVDLAQRRGLVQQVGTGVQIAPVSAPPDPRAWIVERIAGLDPVELEVLRRVALGASTPSGVLLDDSERPIAERLVASGLVDARPGDILRVAHPSFGEVVLAGLDAAQRDDVTAAVAQRLEASGDDDLRFTAVLLRCDTRAGPTPAALEWAVRRAFAMGEHLVAQDLAERRRVVAPGTEPTLGTAVDEASALSALGRLDDAEAAFVRAEGLATSSADAALLVSRWGTHLAYRRFDVDGALALAARFADRLFEQERLALAPEVRTWRILVGHIDAADADAGEASEAEAHPEVAIRGAISAVMLDSMGGRLDGEAARVLATIEAEQGVLDPFASAMVHLQRFFMLLSIGDGVGSARVCEEQRVVCTPDAVGMWSMTLGIHRMYGGLLDEAADLAALAVEQLRWRDPLGFLGYAISLHANVEAQRGDADLARTLLATLVPAQLGDPKTAIQRAEALAYLAMLDDDPEEAVTHLVSASTESAEAGHDLVAAISLGAAIRIGRADVAAPLLDAVRERVGPGLGLYEALADVATGLCEGRPDVVLGAATRLEAAGMRTAAIDAAYQAELRAGAGSELARALRRRRAAWERVSEASSRWAPADGTGDLTEREREIVDLVRRRLTSREIAERLVLSTRTVDNHLASVYRKLGVSGRAELRALFEGDLTA